MTAAFKPGQSVNAKSARNGAVTPGKFVAEHPSAKGSFLEVDHGDGKTNKYRASQVTAA